MPEFDLLNHGLTHARECLESLKEPDDDILPVLMWIGPYGMGVMPLLDMTDDEAKDGLGEMMTTMLAVSRATEAVLITCSWMVMAKNKEEYDAMDVMPRDHPDRVEIISAMYAAAIPDTDSMSSGRITRHPDKPPELGEWKTDMGDMRIGGRFGDAMHMGLDFAKDMPEELIEILDAGWELGEQEMLVERFHTVFQGFMQAMDNFHQGVRDLGI